MTFKESLQEAGKSKNSAYHKFLLSIRPKEAQLFAFVEAADDFEFYRILCEHSLKKRPCFINCGRKSSVYEVYPLVEKRLQGKTEALFFVDKDLDDLVPRAYPSYPKLHVTKYHSIENYLVDKVTFKLFLEECIRFKKGAQVDLEAIVAQFDSAHQRFLELAKPLMAWLLAAWRCNLRPQVKNIKLKQFFEFDENLVPQLSDSAPRICDACALPDENIDFAEAFGELGGLSPKRYVRGKFEAWFFSTFVKKLLEYLAVFNAKSVLPVEENTVVSILSSRMNKDNDVASFLKAL